MEFSTKAGTLQPQQAGAQLFVCTEEAQLNHSTALALLSSLEEGQTFADTKIPTDNGLQAVAVVRLEKTDRAALNKAAAEAAKWAQNQETVNADIHAFDEAQAAAVAEAFAIAFGNAAYRFDRYKKEAKPAKFAQAGSTPHTKPPSKKPCASPKRRFTDKASAATWATPRPTNARPNS